MKVVTDRANISEVFTSAAAEARAAFGDETLYVERFIPNARHIEVQVLGDSFGDVIHLGERDCSLQRRHQKLVEESPAPAITEELREEIRNAAGTFYFLEMNTRIQVEHPVSEMITGIDLVQEQLRVAGGEALRFSQSDVIFRGHAIECRINAELPAEAFRPSPGQILEWRPPEGPNIRLDTHCHAGYTVPPYYDSLLAKLIVYGRDRAEAMERTRRALDRFSISGVGTTIGFLRSVMDNPDFVTGKPTTHLVEDLIEQMPDG
jgi:acetyl-CoA carboxylase biotin carboxylase subunit